ncbi:MAG: glutamate-cysteine ligase family protein [Deltaproteobacteria bacterium]
MSKPMVLSDEEERALLSRPVRDAAPAELEKLFLSAAKPETQWYLGMELELLSLQLSDGMPATHAQIAQILEKLGERRSMERVEEADGALVGLEGDGQIISLEPGGQLEFASRPHRSLQKMKAEVLEYSSALHAAGDEIGVRFLAMGQQPFVNRDTAPRMPKPRYDMMRRYLGPRGARALDMMHLTGSVQCTVDFQSEQNLVDKVRTAARVSPFLSALVAASPFTEGKPNGFKTVRYQIWLETDDERCGLWPEMFDDEGLRPRRYMARAMKAAPMFFMREGKFVPADDKPFAAYAQDGFQGTTVTVSDLLDHLTTFFPEIRTKGYVEMRGADCVLPEEAVAIGGFWRGLLDDEEARREVDERLAAIDYAAARELQPKIATLALDADSPAGPVRDVVKWLTKRAHERLDKSAPDCAECVMPLVERAERGRSPADELLDRAAATSVRDALSIVEI